jgi:teichuronic acid exporter
MSFKKVFAKNLIVSGGFTYLSQIVIFLASLITSRLLTPHDFGLIGLITVFSGFINIFSDSGISMAVIRSGYLDTYYRGLNKLAIMIGIILCIATIFLIYPISLFYKNKDIIAPGIAISFLFVARSFSIVPMAVLQKQMQFGKAGKILFLSTLVGTITTIIMAYVGLKYWSLIWSQFITALVSFIILYKMRPDIFSTTRKAVIAKSFLLARTLIGSLLGFNIINYWARNADNLIAGKYYGTSDLGIYNRAYMMLMLPLTLITGIVSSVLFPSLVKYKNEGGDVQKEYYFMLKIISLINIPIALVLIIFPTQFVQILWGPNWISVGQLLPYFGLLVMTQTLLSTLGSVMIMEKLEKYLMYSGWITAFFGLTGIVFGATISLNGIAAFYALAYITFAFPFHVFYSIMYKMKYKFNFFQFWLPKLILSIIIWWGIYYSVSSLVIAAMVFWVLIILLDTRVELNKILKLFFAFAFKRT